MPVWEWQADELPPEPLMDAVQAWLDEAPSVAEGEAAVASDAPTVDSSLALPPGSAVLEAVALALASLPWQGPRGQEGDAVPTQEAPKPASPPAASPVTANPKPVPAATPRAAPAATPLATLPSPTGRWVLAGWRNMPSYSLLRNVAAERVAEQPSAEDLEHTLSSERQRRHPGCGQP